MSDMDIAGLRARFEGCELVMLGDLSTGTILDANSAVRLGQEHLDRLCATATTIFAPGVEGRSAQVDRPTGRRVFARAGQGSPEVICAVFAPLSDTTGFAQAARAMLDSANEAADA